MASTEDLRELWADAYDGWIGVPGSAPGSVVYLCPEETAAGDENDAAAPPHAPLPRVAQHSAMFALTGHNPMGETADAGANALANEELEEDLRALTAGRSYLGAHAPAPSFWWHSFGFSPQWREDGFVLCFAPAEADAARAAVLRLARKYRQGAAYEYQWVSADASGGQARVLARKTHSVLLPAVDADCHLVVCAKPPWPTAEPGPPRRDPSAEGPQAAISARPVVPEGGCPAGGKGGGGFGEWYQNELKERPLVTKTYSCWVLSSISAIIAETAVKGNYDVKGLLNVVKYAFIMCPPYSHFWYQFLEKVDKKNRVLLRVLADQLFWRPLIIFYSFFVVGAFQGEGIARVWQNIREKYPTVIKNGLKIWPVVQFLNQKYVPVEFRTVSIDCVSFFWDIYLAAQTTFKKAPALPSADR